jgi:hypothetical protein
LKLSFHGFPGPSSRRLKNDNGGVAPRHLREAVAASAAPYAERLGGLGRPFARQSLRLGEFLGRQLLRYGLSVGDGEVTIG